jgi:hypothetical protein
VHRHFGRPVADPKQIVGSAVPRPIDARIEPAERLEPPARERQAQERPRQLAQQVPEGDVGLAHRSDGNRHL